MADTTFDPFAGPAILATAPSTPPQREIWTACALGDEASLSFNESITVRLVGPVDAGALSAALSDLVARHEALRTTVSGDGLTLLIGAPFEALLADHDWSTASDDGAEAQLKQLVEAQVSDPFDLVKGPLFRAHLARLPAGRHALVFTAHHIVCDGWSTAILVRDWAAFYNARVAGVPPSLPPAESLAEYARQREAAVTPERNANEEYWLKQFPGEVPILDLPSDRPRPERKTYRAGREDAVIDGELVAAVRKAGAKSRASLFATLLSAFKVLIYRLSGQADLIIGIPVAGQASEGHDRLVGHCVNMLPLRSSLGAEEPFSALLGRVRRTLLDAQEHQDFTFGTLLTKLPIARDPSRLPLVSVIFNLDRGMTSDDIGFQDLNADLKANPRTYENFELFLNAVEIDGRIELEAQYNRDLFDARTVRRWLDSYRQVLKEIATADAPLADIPIATDEELLQISAWNATDAAFDRGARVHDLVAAAAAKNPQKVALEMGDQSVTYSELDARAARLARALRERGVKRGALVGLCLERSIDLVVGLFAIHKAGGAYVPLDPGYPKERLAFMVEDSAMQVLVTSSDLARELAFSVARTICVDSMGDDPASGSDPLPQDSDQATPDSPAYVIYTSGSTGKPKGVLVPHRAVVNLLASVAKRPGLSADDVVLAITTLSFDIAVSEVWLPLVVGAKIVMVSREIAADGMLLRNVCESRGVTFIDATPATYRLLLAAGFQGGPQLKLICTGEAMPKDLALALPPLAGSVWNGYGPTETTVWSTFWEVPPGTSRVLIGRPVDNTRIYILDPRKKQVPIGVSGELFIAGDGVTLGYWNRPELTADRFLPDPFATDGSRMYRTGDLGRYLNNGDIECLGRNDNQVKLRGFRIELGEIEDALSRHAAIAEAAVILREDRPGDARLVGYVVLRALEAPSAGELRQHLQRTLPDYMVPASYVTLPRMPLTPSGKVDRRALPAPEQTQDSAGADFVAPRSATETLLAELWASALNIGRISVHDDFFALGGHSLLASQILARLRRDHGIDLSFRRFFEAPSVARLAELIDGSPVVEQSAAARIQRRPAGSETPLSLAQERLWLLEEMHPAQRVVHNLPAAWRIVGKLDFALLQQSIDRIAARQEMMRMSLQLRDGRATQHVAESVALPIDRVDLRELPSAEREPAMFERIRKLNAEPFDLTQAPLFRSTLFQLSDDEYLYFTLRHNLIWDGWSFDVFLNELCTIYGALERGESPELPELPVTYGDYAVWQREWVRGPALAEQIAFWQARLEGPVADLALPLDRARPAQTKHEGGNTALAISRSDADALTAVAHGAGTTLFNLAYAAYSVLLHRFTGQTEIVVGTPVRARNLPEVEALIGPFINAIVLRSSLDPREPFTDYLKRVREMTLDSFSNQDMPLELLGARPPVVRAFFSFQDAKARSSSLGSAKVTQVDVEPPAAANDLMLWLMDRPHELLAVANFSTEIFNLDTIQRLLRSFVTLLRDIARNPSRPIGELLLLSPEDRREIDALPAGITGESAGRAYEAFLARARDQAEQAGVVAGEQQLSYADLAGRGRRVASALAGRLSGARAVALVLPMGEPLAVAGLGALLSGARVVAIDPAAPIPYVAALLRAVEPALVVAESSWAPAELSWPRAELSELESSDGERVVDAEAGAAAWWQLSVDEAGQPLRTELSHTELAARVANLAETIGAGHGALVAGISPSAESLPLALLLGPALKVPMLPVSDERELSVTLKRARELGAPCVLAAAEGFRALLSGGENLANVTALVAGPAEPELLNKLRASARRTILLIGSPPPSSVFFACELAGAERPTLALPLGAASVDVVDVMGGTVPVGVVGSLILESDPPEKLALSGRRHVDGRIELLQDATGSRVIDGLRFHPGFVARVLEKHPAVERAFARVIREQGQDSLVAYFAARPGMEFTDTELRRHLRSELPAALVPRSFTELARLPTLADGRVDEAALPLPQSAGAGSEYVAPRSDAERLLAELYAEALGLPRVGIYDNFFDLGGHSLLCFRLIERIESRTGKRMSPRTILLGSLEQVASELRSDPSTSSVRSSAEPRVEPTQPDKSVAGRVFQKLTSLLRR